MNFDNWMLIFKIKMKKGYKLSLTFEPVKESLLWRINFHNPSVRKRRFVLKEFDKKIYFSSILCFQK